MTFEELNLSKPIFNAIEDLGFSNPTPIQKESYKPILSGSDLVGISQTGTGKTLAYLLPLLNELKYSTQNSPRVLVLVPTQELVLQVVESIESLTAYKNIRVQGIYGGRNMNTQQKELSEGLDVLVATPVRLYDLALSRGVSVKDIKKIVIDEVDIMFDLGFRMQLTNILDLLPSKRQNIMFSATMTEEIQEFIDNYFYNPLNISIAVSGTRLENISQSCYKVYNFLTKKNLLEHILEEKETFNKVIIFVGRKKYADNIFESLEDRFGSGICVIHSNKNANYRIRSVEEFESGEKRILVSTDVMARGLDFDNVSHVINFDTPAYPENYIHRIGRTGRAEAEGNSILFYTEKEEADKNKIEKLMGYSIPEIDFPEEVSINNQMIADEKALYVDKNEKRAKSDANKPGPSFHEKSAKNSKENLGSSYKRKIKLKYKKPKTKGDKIQNRKKKR